MWGWLIRIVRNRQIDNASNRCRTGRRSSTASERENWSNQESVAGNRNNAPITIITDRPPRPKKSTIGCHRLRRFVAAFDLADILNPSSLRRQSRSRLPLTLIQFVPTRIPNPPHQGLPNCVAWLQATPNCGYLR